MSNTRPALNLKAAYERVKSKLTGILADIAALWPIAKNSAGNGIYNGKMTISQRGDFTGAGIALANTVYRLDRWKGQIGGDATGDVTLTDESGAIRLTVDTAFSAGYADQVQFVENYSYYAGKAVTISIPLISTNSDAGLQVNDGVNNIRTYHSGSGEEELISTTFIVDGSATQLKVAIGIGLGAGKAAAIGDYIEFTDVRLDLGSHRLSGDREYGEELALCRDYWWQPESTQVYHSYGQGIAVSTTKAFIVIKHGTLHANADSISFDVSKLDLSDLSTFYAVTGISIESNQSSREITILDVTVASGLTAGEQLFLINSNDTDGYLGLGNEL